MKKRKIGGWILSFVLVSFLALGAIGGKFLEWEGKTEMFDNLGYSSLATECR